jgi:hypothetical protein
MLGERFRVMEVEDDGVILASPTGDKQVRLALSGDGTLAPRPPGAPMTRSGGAVNTITHGRALIASNPGEGRR